MDRDATRNSSFAFHGSKDVVLEVSKQNEKPSSKNTTSHTWPCFSQSKQKRFGAGAHTISFILKPPFCFVRSSSRDDQRCAVCVG